MTVLRKRLAKCALVAVGMIVSLTSLTIYAAAQDNPEPLPFPLKETTRLVPADQGDEFNRPAMIVYARVYERTEWVQEPDTGGPPFLTGSYFKLRVLDLVRLNERAPGDPSLPDGFFQIDTPTLSALSMRLELGKDYLLFLNPSKAIPLDLPKYVPTREAGFAIRSDQRVVPLVRRGLLEKYRGRAVDEVMSGIRRLQPVR